MSFCKAIQDFSSITLYPVCQGGAAFLRPQIFSERKNKISETEGSVTDSGRALLVSVLGNSLKLVRNLPDRNMAGALSEKIEDILERLR